MINLGSLIKSTLLKTKILELQDEQKILENRIMHLKEKVESVEKEISEVTEVIKVAKTSQTMITYTD